MGKKLFKNDNKIDMEAKEMFKENGLHLDFKILICFDWLFIGDQGCHLTLLIKIGCLSGNLSLILIGSRVYCWFFVTFYFFGKQSHLGH